MSKIIYTPNDVGKEVINSHGKLTKIRKYHMTDKEQDFARSKWKKEIIHINKSIVEQAGPIFFNPYRKGVYYYQIYAMFLLGANIWNPLSEIVDKMEEIMSLRTIKIEGLSKTAWERFRGKGNREAATRCKDYIGRIQENMVFFQRLNKLHPTGYKLMQVCCAVDMKRIDKSGFSNGCFFYKLHTYSSMEESLPIRDYRDFKFPRHERKYVNSKFIGKIYTKDKIISEGVCHEVSQM